MADPGPGPGQGGRASEDQSTPSRPTVSVVVPFYQAERYLDETLASIEGQTRPVDELILVDDGSTDGGPAIAARRTRPARVVTQPNRGIGAARNAATAVATGTLVAFCDADDLWDPTKLERQLDLLASRPEVGAVLCGVQEFVSPEIDPATAGVRPPRRLDEAAAISALVVRREVLDLVGPFDQDLAVGEWFDWYARLLHAGRPVASVDAVLVRRRLHASNNSRRQRDSRSEYLHVLRAHLDRTRRQP
jgi:glycosyltransferase involved in cell wall biosynthesis